MLVVVLDGFNLGSAFFFDHVVPCNCFLNDLVLPGVEAVYGSVGHIPEVLPLSFPTSALLDRAGNNFTLLASSYF